jgi:hypothetical protein
LANLSSEERFDTAGFEHPPDDVARTGIWHALQPNAIPKGRDWEGVKGRSIGDVFQQNPSVVGQRQFFQQAGLQNEILSI